MRIISLLLIHKEVAEKTKRFAKWLENNQKASCLTLEMYDAAQELSDSTIDLINKALLHTGNLN